VTQWSGAVYEPPDTYQNCQFMWRWLATPCLLPRVFQADKCCSHFINSDRLI